MTNSGIPITVSGDDSQSGAYLLRMQIHLSVPVIFGRFNQGMAITISEGACLYIGSAMNGLGPRLIRHATRSGVNAPHPIRQHMLVYFPAINLSIGRRQTSSNKKLHWHVDYLLEQPQVELTQVIAIRSPLPVEASLARFLGQEPVTSVISQGLGATDAPGDTHLLRVQASETWWHQLPGRIMSHLQAK